MAQFNEILVGRFNRGVQKLFGMKGRVPAPQLASEIVVSHVLASGWENRYLEGWDRFFISVTIPGVAANLSNYRIRNPVSSNRVAVFEFAFIAQGGNGGVMNLGFGPGTADLPTAISGNGRFDPRGGQNTNLVQTQQNNDAFQHLPGAPVLALNIGPNAFQQLISTDIQEFPLLPGDEFGVAHSVVNSPFSLSLWWRERFLEESERT